jgi:uncharacterized membrane protein (UPF0127 family)
MKHVQIRNETRGKILCERCGVAASLFQRIRGLLGRRGLEPDEGLLISPCPSIHMFGMKFAIDAVFITRDYVVTDMVENLLPGKMYVAKGQHGKAHAVIELPAGTIASSGVAPGDKLIKAAE